MKLEANPTLVALGTQQIKNEFESMHLEIQSLHKDKGKEVCVEVWCIKRKASGYHKDRCHVFNNYLNVGGPSPLKSPVWCTICQIILFHDIYSFLRIIKYQPNLK